MKLSKLLIAYDSSACAKAALQDLKRAGLPKRVEAIVATVAYVFLPPPEDEVPNDELVSPKAATMVRPSQHHAEEAVNKALKVAEQGASRLRADFPDWLVSVKADGDAPSWALIRMAADLNVDLIIIGSHRHSSAGGRLILGSVSQRVLYEALCSVRVARCAHQEREGPVRIVVGLNSSNDSDVAVDAVASRDWPPGSEVRLITSRDEFSQDSAALAIEKLRSVGLTISEHSSEHDSAHALIKEAEAWSADSIFISTKDVHGFQHLLHGSVSLEVAARAQCSVEVVRSSKQSTSKN